MPLAEIAENDVTEALKAGADDLRYNFEENQVGSKAQAILIRGGVNSMKRLAKFAAEEGGFRLALRTHVNIDENESLEMRCLVADLSSAWTDAVRITKREADIRAEARASDTEPRIG